MISKSALSFLMSSFPFGVKAFLARCLIIFIVFQCYFIGFETNSRFLNAPLTNQVASSSVQILNQFYSKGNFSNTPRIKEVLREGALEKNYGNTIYTNQKAILYIADSCNGLELIALYLGFIIAMQTKIIRKIKYCIVGGIFIYYMNVLRCIGLIILQINSSKHFEFAHHYLFKLIVYSSILMLWHFYMENISLQIEKSQ